MLASLLAVPLHARCIDDWHFHNKPAVLRYPLLLPTAATEAHPTCYGDDWERVAANLRAAGEAGVSYIDPRAERARQSHQILFAGPRGFWRQNLRDYCWCAPEKDWPTWLIASNVTVLDIGTRSGFDVPHVLFKGVPFARVQGPCPSNVSIHARHSKASPDSCVRPQKPVRVLPW
jgi:hypothetical protein